MLQSRHIICASLVTSAVGVFAWQSEAKADQAVFTPIPFLPYNPESSGRSVSHDGQYVAGHSAPYSFRWSVADGHIQLDPLPETGFARYGWISGDGSKVVGSSVMAGTVNRSTMWSAPDWEPVYLGPNLADSDFFSSSHVDMALGISGNGSVVIGQSATEFINTPYHSAAGYHPYRWTETTGMETLVSSDKLNSTFGAAYGVNHDGSVIVGWYRPAGSGQMHAFRWVEGVTDGLEFLGTLGGGSEAWDVTSDGSVIIGNSTVSGQGRTAFRWTEKTGMVALGQFSDSDGSHNTVPLATSDTGVLVGYAMIWVGTWTHLAIIWDEDNGWRDLKQVLEQDYGIHLAGWTLTEARDIAPDGRVIVGQGINPSGFVQGWHVELYPQPGCLGDLNGDGTVDGADLLILLSEWGECVDPDDCPADFNDDGNVDGADLLILLGAWGQCP